MDTLDKKIDNVARKLDGVQRGVNRAITGCVALLTNMFLAAFCLWGVYAGYTSWQLETNGATTPGRVVELASQSDGDGGCCTYVPVVEYQVNGQTYTVEGDTASDPPAYAVGDAVSVLYDPAQPAQAQLNNWQDRWLMPLILIPAMLLTAGVINFFMWRAWRRGDSVLDE